MGLFDNISFTKLKSGLSKTRNKIVDSISETITGKAVKDELISVISNGNLAKTQNGNDTIRAKPYVVLIVGVNGVGKTTTIGKLAHNYKSGGAKVLVGAADTFRAAAGEQLDIWAERAGADIIQKARGSDPSSVAYETIEKAVKNNYDVALIDTAGRLHNKANLIN